MYNNYEELKYLIIAKLDVTEILDILGWEVADLVDALDAYIHEAEEAFRDAVE